MGGAVESEGRGVLEYRNGASTMHGDMQLGPSYFPAQPYPRPVQLELLGVGSVWQFSVVQMCSGVRPTQTRSLGVGHVRGQWACGPLTGPGLDLAGQLSKLTAALHVALWSGVPSGPSDALHSRAATHEPSARGRDALFRASGPHRAPCSV